MARTTATDKGSPYRHRLWGERPNSTLNRDQHLPSDSDFARPARPRVIDQNIPPNNGASMRSHRKFSSPTRKNSRISHTSHKLRLSDLAGDTCHDIGLDTALAKKDTDSGTFIWEEESALLSEMINENPKETESARLSALVESLQVPFGLQGDRLKREIAHSYVPTVNHVRSIYQKIEARVDVPFKQGLHEFETTSRQLEVNAMMSRDKISEAYKATNRKIEKLFEQLQDAYTQRDALWYQFETEFNDIVSPVIDSLKASPANIEKTISRLEKQSQTHEKENDSKSFEKKLHDVLLNF